MAWLSGASQKTHLEGESGSKRPVRLSETRLPGGRGAQVPSKGSLRKRYRVKGSLKRHICICTCWEGVGNEVATQPSPYMEKHQLSPQEYILQDSSVLELLKQNQNLHKSPYKMLALNPCPLPNTHIKIKAKLRREEAASSRTTAPAPCSVPSFQQDKG